jgi:hypothetical protein
MSFHVPHMEYEGSIGLVSIKMIFLIADFHVLGLFMAVTRRCCCCALILGHASSLPLES